MNLSALVLSQFLLNVLEPIPLKVQWLDDIVESLHRQQDIFTLAFFGDAPNMSAYVKIRHRTPKMITSKTDWDKFSKKRIDVNRQILFISVGDLMDKPRIEQLNKVFRNIQGSTRGLFVVPATISRPTKKMTAHFQWCWENGFARMLVLVENKDRNKPLIVYRYRSYPYIYYERNDNEPRNVVYLDKFINLKGYSVETPVFYDPPRVFDGKEQIPQNNIQVFKGYAGLMFNAMLNHINGTLNISLNYPKQDNILSVIEQLKSGKIDIAVNTYMPYEGVQLSYPIKMLKWCIAVPASKEVEVFEYFLRPYQATTWYTIIGCLVYLTLLNSINIGVFLGEKYHIDFGRAALQILRILLNLPASILKRKALPSFRVMCFMQATVLGFILSSLYLALLTSLLAITLFQPQIDTLNEIVAANLSIFATRHEIPILLKSSTYPEGFADLLIPKNQLDIIQGLLKLDNQYSYCAFEDLLSFALEQQTNMRAPLIHVAQECLTTVPLGFLMRPNSQLEPVVSNFILRAASVGLTEFWEKQSRIDALHAGILRKQFYSTHSSPSSHSTVNSAIRLEHLQFAWFLLGVGLILSILSFIVEIINRIICNFQIFKQFSFFLNK